MKILIVEDSPADRQLIRYLLEEKFKSEAKFREVSNLASAFRYLETGEISCVILDLQLPDSVGKDTFERINNRFPDVPIIIMTNNKDLNLAIAMIQAGAADYVLKDFSEEAADDIFRRILFAIEKHSRSVRMPKDKAASVHTLERARANMMTAHTSGEHIAIQATTLETTNAVADLSRRMFTELQLLSGQLAQNRARDETIAKVVETLETELLKGSGGRRPMRSQVDLLEHRIETIERRFSDFREVTDKRIEATGDKTERKIEEIRSDLKSSEDTQRLSAVHIQHTSMTNRTKLLLGIFTLLGVIATALATYEASKHGVKVEPTEKAE